MPTIRPYIQDESALAGIPGRRASGEDFGGSGLQLLGHTIGDEGAKAAIAFEEAKAREEVTDAQTKLAEFEARKTLELDEGARTTDLEQAREFSSSFNDRLQPELQKLGDAYETKAGQQAFQRGAGEVSGHFLKQAGLTQAHMMGVQAKQNWLLFENAKRNAVLNNPLDYDRQKRLVVEALNDPNGLYFGHLKSEERAVMTRTAVENLAESAVRGIIRAGAPELLKQLNGADAPELLKQLNGAVYADLNAADKERLEEAADIAIRAKEVEANRLLVAKERERKEQARSLESNMIFKLGGGKDGTDTLTNTDIITSGLLEVDPDKAKELVQIVHSRSREQLQPVVTDPTVMTNLARDIRTGRITDEGPLNLAYNAQQLAWPQFEELRKELTDWRTPEGKVLGEEKERVFTLLKTSITKSMFGSLDPSGDREFLHFQQFVDREIERYKREKKDPYSLLTFGSPDYVGRPDGPIKNFLRSGNESMSEIEKLMNRPNRTQAVKEGDYGVTEEQKYRKGETGEQWRARQKK